MKPTITPPVPLKTSIQWNLDGVSKALENDDRLLLEAEILKWSRVHTANTIPKITFTKVVIEKNFFVAPKDFTTRRRRLSETSLGQVLLQVRFEGTVRPEDKDTNLNRLMRDLTDQYGNVLAQDLKTLSSESATYSYFRNVKTLKLSEVSSPIPSSPPSSADTSDNKTIIIMVAAIGGALILLIIAGFLYLKKR